MIRVVLADEHTLFRTGLCLLLREHGIDVVGDTNSGRTTLDLVANHAPDVVVVGLTLVDQSGIEAIHALRAAEVVVPILALAPFASELVRQSALQAGASGIVTKADDIREMVTAIHGKSAKPMQKRRKDRYISLRQIKILRGLTAGRTNDEIAQSLSLSRSSIKGELRSLFNTFATQDRSELIGRAASHGLIGAMAVSGALLDRTDVRSVRSAMQHQGLPVARRLQSHQPHGTAPDSPSNPPTSRCHHRTDLHSAETIRIIGHFDSRSLPIRLRSPGLAGLNSIANEVTTMIGTDPV